MWTKSPFPLKHQVMIISDILYLPYMAMSIIIFQNYNFLSFANM